MLCVQAARARSRRRRSRARKQGDPRAAEGAAKTLPSDSPFSYVIQGNFSVNETVSICRTYAICSGVSKGLPDDV